MNKYTKNFDLTRNRDIRRESDIFCFVGLGIMALLLIVTVYVVNTTLI